MADISSGKRNEPIPEVQGNILPDYIIRDFKLCMWIPSELAGKVIGKQGVSISHIEQQAKARTIKPLPAVGDSLWTAFAIVGEWNSIVAAYKAISDVVNGEVDDVVLEYTINYRKRFFLYGKHAQQIIKTISARSNVRIFYPEFNIKEQTFKEAVPMTLEGSFENVLKAVALLEQEALLYVEHQKALQKAEEEREAKRERDAQTKATGTKKDANGPPATEDGKWIKSTVPIILERKPISNGSSKPGASSGPPATEDGHHKKKSETSTTVTAPAVPAKTVVGRGSSARDETHGTATKSNSVTAPASTNVVSSSSQPQSTTDTTASTPAQPANKAKAPAVPFVTNIVPHPGPKPPLEELPNGSFSQVIHVPNTIVGLLLSKKSFVRVSIMNQIQNSTGTYISKVGDKKGGRKQSKAVATATAKAADKGNGKPRRRRQSASDSEEEGSDDDEDGDESDDEDSDDEDEVESAVEDVKEDPNKNSSPDSDFVDFVIVGTPSTQVTVAYTMLDRIIRGERIKDVMETLPKPPRASSGNKKDSVASRGSKRKEKELKENKEHKERSQNHSEKTSKRAGASAGGEEVGANKKAPESTAGPVAATSTLLSSDPAKRESNLRQRGEGRQSRSARVVSDADSSNKANPKDEAKADKIEKEPKRPENSRAESLLVAGREKAAERDAAAVAAAGGGGEGRGAGGRGGAGRGRGGSGSGGRGRGREGRGGGGAKAGK